MRRFSKEQLAIQSNYVTQIDQRNREEKEFFKNFVNDYLIILQELKKKEKDVLNLRIENDQIRTKHGDPIKLRQVTEELQMYKSKEQMNDLDQVTQTLQLTQEKAKLSEINRDLERQLEVHKQKCQEYELILTEKANVLESVQKELAIHKAEGSGTESRLLMLEERNTRLKEDNNNLVKQMIKMKESRA